MSGISFKIREDTGALNAIKQDLFLEKVKTALVQAIESAIGEKGKVSAKIKPKGVEITVHTDRVKSSSADNPDYFNTISADDYSNTVTEKEFKNQILESAQTITKDLYKLYLDSDKLLK